MATPRDDSVLFSDSPQDRHSADDNEGERLISDQEARARRSTAAAPLPKCCRAKVWTPILAVLGILALLSTLILFLLVRAKEVEEAAKPKPPIRVFTDVVKPQHDKRGYAYLTLDNGLQALLVSDPDTVQAAAAVDVEVGSWYQPEQYLGLPHFLEHMLFLGTKKYPDEEEYARYLGQYGGSWNAYTDDEHTNYFFTVGYDALEGALDRFAQFFVAPLLSADATAREMNAVNSENSKNLNSDPWRLNQIMKNSSSPDTSFALFSTGNLATLNRTGIRSALLRFHAKHYTAPNMKVVVVGREPVGELANMTIKYFSDVKAAASSLPLPDGDHLDLAGRSPSQPQLPGNYPTLEKAWPYGTLGKVIYYKPIAQQHLLSFAWPLPPGVSQHAHSREALSLVSHVLGHEGTHSIVWYLRQENLADSISAGFSVRGRGFTMLEVEVGLTVSAVETLGLDTCAQRVGAAMFHQLRLLTAAIMDSDAGGKNHYLWEDMIKEVKQSYAFGAKSTPSEFVQTMARRMHAFQASSILDPPDQRQWHKDAAAEVLDLLSPDRLLLFVVSSAVNTATFNAYESWYDVHFRRQWLPVEWTSSWRNSTIAAVHLPLRNPYFPENYDIVATEEEWEGLGTNAPQAMEVPAWWYNGTAAPRNLTMWELPDLTFQMPSVKMSVKLSTLFGMGSSPKEWLLRSLWAKCFDRHIAERTYEAALAGFSFGVALDAPASAVQFSISGYRSGMLDWVEYINTLIDGFDPSVQRIQEYMKLLTLEASNELVREPYIQVLRAQDVLFNVNSHSASDVLAYLKSAAPPSPTELVEFGQQVFTNVSITCLVYGNIQPEDGYTLLFPLLESLGAAGYLRPIDALSVAAANITRLHASHAAVPGKHSDLVVSTAVGNPQEDNSALLLTFPAGLRDFCERGHIFSGRRTAVNPSPTTDCLRAAATWSVLSKMLYQPTFDTLRTEQQLGYVVMALGRKSFTRVWAEGRELAGTSGLVTDELISVSFLLQGTVLPCSGMLNRTLAFLAAWGTVLEATEEVVVEDTARAMASEISAPFQSQEEVFAAMSREVNRGQHFWDRYTMEAAALKAVSRNDVVALYQSLIGTTGGRVALCKYGKNDPGLSPPAEDPLHGHWKNTSSLHYLASEDVPIIAY